jgi:flagellar motility protein MotE (MotC chaperone)
MALLFTLLILKGVVMFSLVTDERGATCLAEMTREEAARTFGKGEAAADCCRDSMGELISKIRQENESLVRKAESLDEEERKLRIFSNEIAEKTEILARMRGEVEKMYQEIAKREQETQTKIVKIYEAMEPEDAAVRLETMEDGAASEVIMSMNGRKAGQILGVISPDKAARITRRIAELTAIPAK